MLAVQTTCAGADALHVARPHDGGVAHAVLMLQSTGHYISDNFHVPMRVHSKAAAAEHDVIVDDAQRAEAHMLGIVIVGKGKGKVSVQPAMIGVATFFRFSECHHILHLSFRAPS